MTVTPRIQDVATTEQARRTDAAKTENTTLEPGKHEKVVVVAKTETEVDVGRKELRLEEKEEDSKEDVRKSERREETGKKEETGTREETEERSSDTEVREVASRLHQHNLAFCGVTSNPCTV